MYALPVLFLLTSGLIFASSGFDAASAQNSASRMKPVDDPVADVLEFIPRKVPLDPSLILQVPEILDAEKEVTWDERKLSLAAWMELRRVLGSQKLFREIRIDGPGDLTFHTTTLDAAPSEGMHGSLLEVEGRLLDNRTGGLLGRVRVLAVATGQAGEVSPEEAEEIPNRVAAALVRFIRRVFR